mmetsp:Transcript_38902/g.101782  ORF Transcript_38902/g.101782 Transcript_38902/m.101782 type:complete len:263 (-) Transcript_38902:499-1287(-)
MREISAALLNHHPDTHIGQRPGDTWSLGGGTIAQMAGFGPLQQELAGQPTVKLSLVAIPIVSTLPGAPHEVTLSTIPLSQAPELLLPVVRGRIHPTAPRALVGLRPPWAILVPEEDLFRRRVVIPVSTQRHICRDGSIRCTMNVHQWHPNLRRHREPRMEGPAHRGNGRQTLRHVDSRLISHHSPIAAPSGVLTSRVDAKLLLQGVPEAGEETPNIGSPSPRWGNILVACRPVALRGIGALLARSVTILREILGARWSGRSW